MNGGRRYSLGMRPRDIIGIVWLIAGVAALLTGLFAPLQNARFALAAGAAASLVGAALTVSMIARRRSLRRVIREDRIITARVTETMENAVPYARIRGVVRPPKPRYITCVGTDPDTGKTRTFRSKYLYSDGFAVPNGAEVKVFVDRNGRSDLYFVDIDPLIARHAINAGRMV